MRYRALSGWTALGLLVAPTSYPRERPQVPAFPAHAEVITVDVVVLDKDGRPIRAPSPTPTGVTQFPALAEAVTVDVVVLDQDSRLVTGLARTDFTIHEDGRPQAIVGFEPRELTPGAEAEAPVEEGRIATNEGAGPSGRTLAFVIDDLGIEPTQMSGAAAALTRWLAEGADPRDQVTLVTSSGEAWWSDSVGEGRGDFEALLRRIKGKKALAAAHDALSDWESYSIDTVGLGRPADQQPALSGPPSGTATCSPGSSGDNVLDRVIDRWFRTGACICDPMDVGKAVAVCRMQVTARAREVYGAATRRAVGLLGAIERVSRGLSAARGRKAVVVLSEGLLRDTDQRAFERAVDASRRGNTAVSFVDVRGLLGQPLYATDQVAPPRPGDIGVTSVETRLLETAGGEYLAETTGGSMMRDTNDLAGAVTRLADESSAYYLLGYQPGRRLDGKWRKLTVKVSRPGLTVKARWGYFATATPPPIAVAAAGKRGKKKKGQDELPVRALDPALAVGGERAEIGLRIAPHVFELDAEGVARVLVALEVDTSKLMFLERGSERAATLDVTILGVSRDRATVVPLDAKVELTVDASAAGGWWAFSRELRLPPGAAQIRALVRDAATARSGLVAQRLVIPPPGAPYLSTPILTDRALPGDGKGPPKLVAVARRRFTPRGHLYCAYEVYPAPGRELRVIPRILAGYTVEDEGGRVVAFAQPAPIAIALGARFSRIHAIPLDRLAPGRYQLRIQANDPVSGFHLEAIEGFVIEPPSAADSPRP